MKITIEAHGKTFSVELSYDSNISDTLDAIIITLIGVGFTKELIMECLKEIAAEQ